jgi:hypothetical protein
MAKGLYVLANPDIGCFMNKSPKTPFTLGQDINRLLKESQVSGVNCQCAGSLVVLRGTVTHPNARQRAISIARQCCGMNEISNEIHVVS